MQLKDYTVAVAKHTEIRAAIRLLSTEIRQLLSEGWVPFEGFSHMITPSGTGEYNHILTQPMIK